MVFCNFSYSSNKHLFKSHNPYFNRWFSAIFGNYGVSVDGKIGHNPYFNRWFSAMSLRIKESKKMKRVTILILIDGFLQYSRPN